MNEVESIVPNEKMDIDFEMRGIYFLIKKPLDLCAPMWHAELI